MAKPWNAPVSPGQTMTLPSTYITGNVIQWRYSVPKDVKVIVDVVIPCSHSERFGSLLLTQLKIPDLFYDLSVVQSFFQMLY